MMRTLMTSARMTNTRQNRNLGKLISIAVCCALLTACLTSRSKLAPLPWNQRLNNLQHVISWQLDGRAAVVVGTQGWQASLNWQQTDAVTDLHLAGPFGIGAVAIEKTSAGLTLNGAPPSDLVLREVHERLGFDLPMDTFRYWLLGVPDPNSTFELTRNAQDRALKLTQDGWTVDYDKYMQVNGDLMPAHIVLSREGVRVRIVVERWEGLR
jgi:outer membrane lipoprotein LolB